MRKKPDWKKVRKELAKVARKRAQYTQAVNMLRNYSTEEILFDRLLCAFEKFFQYTESTLKKIEAARKIDQLMMDIERIESKKTTGKRKKKKEDLLYEDFLTALKAFQVYAGYGLRKNKAAKKISGVRKKVASIYREEIKRK